jgi:hypothetical protein
MLQTIHWRLAGLIIDRRGQDMLEYALLGGFVASCAMAMFPAITATGTYFSRVIAVLSTAVLQTAAQ